MFICIGGRFCIIGEDFGNDEIFGLYRVVDLIVFFFFVESKGDGEFYNFGR